MGGGGEEGEREGWRERIEIGGGGGRGREGGGREKGVRRGEEGRGELEREFSFTYMYVFYSPQSKSRLEKLKNQVDYHGRCKKMREKLEK